jgi:A/G-specific adenine glycosylase
MKDPSDVGAPATRDRFRSVAQQWLGRHQPAAFNQALMELGATVCLPRSPRCDLCPVSAHCQAHRHGNPAELPIKMRKQTPVRLEEVLLVVQNRGRVLLRQRASNARRMAGFWDLPGPADLPHARVADPIGEFRHTITHHHYTFVVLGASAVRPTSGAIAFRFFSLSQLVEIPLSTVARKGLQLAGVIIS